MLPNSTKVNLKTVAERVGLAPCSVSSVLNRTPASRTIPQATRDRIFRAAAELNYRPNFWARSLRTKRTRMIAVVTPDFGLAAIARTIAAAQARLDRAGYLLVLMTVQPSELAQNTLYFESRGFEGVIAIDAAVPIEVGMHVACVDLSYLPSSHRIDRELQSWLHDLGTAAADAVIRAIESGESTARIDVSPRLKPAFFAASASAERICRNEQESA